MPVIYVARSKSLSDWGASVGISKSLFKVGVAEGTGKTAVAALNDEECAGLDDWRLVGSEDAADVDEEQALERLGKTGMVVEPTYYPRKRGRVFFLRTQECDLSFRDGPRLCRGRNSLLRRPHRSPRRRRSPRRH